MKLLYVSACVRTASRTKRIADALIERIGVGCEITILDLPDMDLKPLDEVSLEKRTMWTQAEDFSDESFELAKQFASADIIVIAAPYWDGSFPACLKVYIENIYVTGIVSKYGNEGNAIGMCNAQKLYYVTTAGGPYKGTFSYDYIRKLALYCFGVKETELICAEMLDVDGYDSERIVEETINRLA